MDRAHSFQPRPCSPALRTIPSGALLVHDGDHRPLFLPAPRAGGRTPVTTPFGTVGEGLQTPQRFQCLPTKPDERAQHRWPPVSGAATPPLPRVRSISRPAIPFMPSHRSAHTPDCRSETERSAYPVDLAVSRETCSALRWYSVSTVRTPLHRLLRHPHAPMRRRMHSQSK